MRLIVMAILLVALLVVAGFGFVSAGPPGEVDKLVGELHGGGNGDASSRAASRLASLGEPGLGPLVAALRSGGVQARAHAAAAVGTMILMHPDLRARVEAAAAPALVPLTRDPDRAVKHNAAGSLADMDANDPAMLAELLGDPEVRMAVATVLARRGERVVAVCRMALRSPRPAVRDGGIGGIGLVRGPEVGAALPELLALATGPDVGVATRVVPPLSQIGPPARAAMPRLVGLLATVTDEREISNLAAHLARIGLPPALIPQVLPLLDRPQVRGVAEFYGDLLASAGAAGVPALVARLDDDRPAIRVGCLVALARLKTAARPAEGRARALVADRGCREAAVRALLAMEAPVPEAVPLLIADLIAGSSLGWDPGGTHTFVRSPPTRLLGQLGPAAVPALIATLDRPELPIRFACVTALDRIGPPAAPAVPALRRLALEAAATPRPGRPAFFGSIPTCRSLEGSNRGRGMAGWGWPDIVDRRKHWPERATRMGSKHTDAGRTQPFCRLAFAGGAR